jgi:hypothetical protein
VYRFNGISLASSSVGSKQATYAYKLHLKQLHDEYDLACLQIQAVEREIIAVLERIPFAKFMLAVKGINAISLVGIKAMHAYNVQVKKIKKKIISLGWGILVCMV